MINFKKAVLTISSIVTLLSADMSFALSPSQTITSPANASNLGDARTVVINVGGTTKYILPGNITRSAFPGTGTDLPAGCSGATETETQVTFTCGDLYTPLSDMKVVPSMTWKGTNLPDYYAPKYYLLKTTVTNPDSTKIVISGGNAYYNDNLKSVRFNIYDYDSTGGSGGIFEGTNYSESPSDKNPVLSVQAFMLDSSRITDSLLARNAYSLENYLTKASQTTETWGATTLNYDLGVADNTTMIYDDYARLCNVGVDPTKISVKWPKTINDLSSTTMQTFSKGSCSTKGLLLDGSFSGFPAAISQVNGSLPLSGDGTARNENRYGFGSGTPGNITLDASTSDSSGGVVPKPFNYFDLDTSTSDGSDASIQIPLVGLIDNSNFVNGAISAASFSGKPFTLYFLVKISSRWPDASAPRHNRYLQGLDPLNPEYSQGLGNTAQVNYIIGYYCPIGGVECGSPDLSGTAMGTYPSKSGGGNMFVPYIQYVQNSGGIKTVNTAGGITSGISSGSNKVFRQPWFSFLLNESKYPLNKTGGSMPTVTNGYMYYAIAHRALIPAGTNTLPNYLRNGDADSNQTSNATETSDQYDNDISYAVYLSKGNNGQVKFDSLVQDKAQLSSGEQATSVGDSPASVGVDYGLTNMNGFLIGPASATTAADTGVLQGSVSLSGNSNPMPGSLPNGTNLYQQFNINSTNDGAQTYATIVEVYRNIYAPGVANQIYIAGDTTVSNDPEPECSIRFDKLVAAGTSAMSSNTTYVSNVNKGVDFGTVYAADVDTTPRGVFRGNLNSDFSESDNIAIVERSGSMGVALAKVKNQLQETDVQESTETWAKNERGIMTFQCKNAFNNDKASMISGFFSVSKNEFSSDGSVSTANKFSGSSPISLKNTAGTTALGFYGTTNDGAGNFSLTTGASGALAETTTTDQYVYGWNATTAGNGFTLPSTLAGITDKTFNFGSDFRIASTTTQGKYMKITGTIISSSGRYFVSSLLIGTKDPSANYVYTASAQKIITSAPATANHGTASAAGITFSIQNTSGTSLTSDGTTRRNVGMIVYGLKDGLASAVTTPVGKIADNLKNACNDTTDPGYSCVQTSAAAEGSGQNSAQYLDALYAALIGGNGVGTVKNTTGTTLVSGTFAVSSAAGKFGVTKVVVSGRTVALTIYLPTDHASFNSGETITVSAWPTAANGMTTWGTGASSPNSTGIFHALYYEFNTAGTWGAKTAAIADFNSTTYVGAYFKLDAPVATCDTITGLGVVASGNAPYKASYATLTDLIKVEPIVIPGGALSGGGYRTTSSTADITQGSLTGFYLKMYPDSALVSGYPYGEAAFITNRLAGNIKLTLKNNIVTPKNAGILIPFGSNYVTNTNQYFYTKSANIAGLKTSFQTATNTDFQTGSPFVTAFPATGGPSGVVSYFTNPTLFPIAVSSNSPTNTQFRSKDPTTNPVGGGGFVNRAPEDRQSFYGFDATADSPGQVQVDASMVFSVDAKNGSLSGKTCPLGTYTFPATIVQADCNIDIGAISESASNSHAINSCGTGSASSNSMSLDYGNMPNSITYHVPIYNNGGGACDNLSFRMNFNRSIGSSFGSATITGPGAVSATTTSNAVNVTGLSLAGWESNSVDITFAIPKNTSDLDQIFTSSATLTDNSAGTTVTASSADFKKCMLPTLQIGRAWVDDGNAGNDFTVGTYVSAYPFEFSQCGNSISYNMEVKLLGFSGNDARLKDWNVQFLTGNAPTPKASFINTMTGNTVAGVAGTVSGKDSVTWNMAGGNIATLVSQNNNTLTFRASVTPFQVPEIRLENSKFVLTNNQGTYLTIDTANASNITCSGNDNCTSSNLSAEIGRDPVVSGQKIYDQGIYADPDNNTDVMYVEETDGTSKSGTIAGAAHYEPVIFEATVANPAINASYHLGTLSYDLKMNSQQSIFTGVAPAPRVNVGTNISAAGGSGAWGSQSLTSGSSKSYKGYFLMKYVVTAAVPDMTTYGTGTPSLQFTGTAAPDCAFNQGFVPWSVKLAKNPITVNEFKFSDDIPSNSTTAGGIAFDEHTPGDTVTLSTKVHNYSPNTDFTNVKFKFALSDNLAGINTGYNVTNALLAMNLSSLFEFTGSANAGYYDFNGGQHKCRFETSAITGKETDLVCIIPSLPRNADYQLDVGLRINIAKAFYDQIKSIADTEKWKYWYPFVLKDVQFGTPDLNSITHPIDGAIVYYTSDETHLPAGKARYIDFTAPDINDPANDPTILANLDAITPPLDNKFSFFIGMPYLSVKSTFSNLSGSRLSPGDVFQAKGNVTNIGEAKVRNPILTLDATNAGLGSNWVDTEARNAKYAFTKSNVTATSFTQDYYALNNDGNPANDINVDGTTIVRIRPGNSAIAHSVVANPEINIYTDTTNLMLDGSWDHATGGTIDASADIAVKQLKTTKFPQIGCSSTPVPGCDRGTGDGTNPKHENIRSVFDIPYVALSEDGDDISQYDFYFPILKSYMFAKSTDAYKLTGSTNPYIRGVINGAPTTVTWRMDNFIPSGYTNFATQGVGKARDPYAYIRLPMGVRYVNNSSKKIDNLQDVAPYGTVAATSEPTITEVNDYVVTTNTGVNSFPANFKTTWNLVKGTNTLNYALYKGSPFKFNVYNKSYNYYRITDDGSLSIGYPQESTTFDEGAYYDQKTNGRIRAAAGQTLIVKFEKTVSGVRPPAGVSFIGDDGLSYVADGVATYIVKADTTISLNGGQEIQFIKGLDNVSYSPETALAEFSTNVSYGNADFLSYKTLSPIFTKIDTRDVDHKGHGIYEKVFYDALGDVEKIGYVWYGYAYGTKKEVQFAAWLYGGKTTNNIKFSYGPIDPGIAIPAVSGISTGQGAVVGTFALTPYSGTNVSGYSNADDITFDASGVYQELKYKLGVAADPLDPSQTSYISFQDKDPITGSFVKGPGKDNTGYAIQFDVNITTDDTVCGTEYVTSLGGNSLQWGRKDSLQPDTDDINMACFSAMKPGIAIIDNASYAYGGYKYSGDTCAVKHVALAGFNATAIGWNTVDAGPTCWDVWAISSAAKDLTLKKVNPYNGLPEFLEKTDKRDSDITKTLQNSSVKATLVGKIKVLNETTGNYDDINVLIPNVTPMTIHVVSKSALFIVANDLTNSYVLLSDDGGDHFKIVQKFLAVQAEKAYFRDGLGLVFFKDGTYARNTSNGVGAWSNGALLNKVKLNDIAWRTVSNGFVIGNDGKMWETTDSGSSWTYRDVKTEVTPILQPGENLKSMDTYASVKCWITTDRGTVLYSENNCKDFVRKTSGTAIETPLMDFEN